MRRPLLVILLLLGLAAFVLHTQADRLLPAELRPVGRAAAGAERTGPTLVPAHGGIDGAGVGAGAEDAVEAPGVPSLQPPVTVPPIATIGDPAQSAGAEARPSGRAQQSALRRRVGEAAGLAQRARAGDAAAAAEVMRRLASEPDPRMRQALATGAMPDLGRLSFRAPPVLPEPMSAAEPGEVRAYWLTPQSHDGTYESTVKVDAQGHAQVETVYESPGGERWQVRYGGWAFRDSQGRLVVDARGQPVEYVQRPEWGLWSPDSMVIGRDGLIDMIDDKHDSGEGTSGARGPG